MTALAAPLPLPMARETAPSDARASAPALCWVDVCALDELPPDCGAPALIGGRQVALVRVGGGDRGGGPDRDGDRDGDGDGEQIYALSNFDPFSEAFVIARGIVGDHGGKPKIASPIYKQSFDLATGVCLDDAKVSLRTYPVRVRGRRIEVAVPAFERTHGTAP